MLTKIKPKGVSMKAKQGRKKKTKKKKFISFEEFFQKTKAKASFVEFFDDRFYKWFLPKLIDPSVIANFKKSCLFETEKFFIAFAPGFHTVFGVLRLPWLEEWKSKVGYELAAKLSEIAKDKGSNVHKAAELYARNIPIIYRNLKTESITPRAITEFKKQNKISKVHIIYKQEEMICLDRLYKLCNAINPTFKEAETNVLNWELCYSTTIDGLWHLEAGEYPAGPKQKIIIPKTGLWLIDYKTGTGYDDIEITTQLIAGINAHILKDKIVGGIGIHLNSKNVSGIHGVKLHIKEKEEMNPYFDYFKAILNIFYLRMDLGIISSPKFFDVPQILMPFTKFVKTRKKK